METVRSDDGTTIAFDRSGQGPPVVYVPGAFQHRAIDQSVAQLCELLAPDFTVYHYDRRGRGDSGDTLPYAVEREVEDLAALVDHAGGAAAVVGMSSGGALALQAAASGVAITGLALYEPPFAVGGSAPPADFGKRFHELVAAERRGDAVELFLTGAIGVPAEGVAQMRQMPVWAGLESVAHTLAYDMAVMGDGSVPADRIADVTIPVLAIDGGESPQPMRDAVQMVVDALPNAERRTLEGQTHEVAPDVLAPVLREFFARELTSSSHDWRGWVTTGE
jgi:pimeloyl-ACP methyl ester carboxylesterase